MSATAASLQCPICCHSGVFDTAECLRNRLIYVSTNKLPCPVCQEEVSGLDKLTIHLFSHVKLLNTDIHNQSKNHFQEKSTDPAKHSGISKQVTSSIGNKKSKPVIPKNKVAAITTNTPVKFVKIYPKLPVISVKTVPTINETHVTNADKIQTNSTPSTSDLSKLKNKAMVVLSNTTCNVCNLQFVDANILKMHNSLVHNIEDPSNQSCTRYNCHLCPKNFKMRGSLMVHLRVAHYGFNSGNVNSDSNRNLDGADTGNGANDKIQLLLKSDNKQWQCEVCRKCFTTKYFLKKHKRLHTGETPYSCTQCSKTFTFQQSYHKHLLYHNDEKPHICSFCGRAFKELSTLHNHQRIHTGEKPFSCETCGKCFRQRVSYLVHRRIHTGVMPYKCTACEKSFRYKVSQRTHKCTAQPPGTVVRQNGDLIEKLKKKHTNANNYDEIITLEKNEKSKRNCLEISEINAELVRSGAKLSFEDTENDNFTLIADAFRADRTDFTCVEPTCENIDILPGLLESNFDELIDGLPEDKNVPSPSDILKKLCLSHEDDVTGTNEADVNNLDFAMLHEFM